MSLNGSLSNQSKNLATTVCSPLKYGNRLLMMDFIVEHKAYLYFENKLIPDIHYSTYQKHCLFVFTFTKYTIFNPRF